MAGLVREVDSNHAVSLIPQVPVRIDHVECQSVLVSGEPPGLSQSNEHDLFSSLVVPVACGQLSYPYADDLARPIDTLKVHYVDHRVSSSASTRPP
jgi:hypothetical protein